MQESIALELLNGICSMVNLLAHSAWTYCPSLPLQKQHTVTRSCDILYTPQSLVDLVLNHSWHWYLVGRSKCFMSTCNAICSTVLKGHLICMMTTLSEKNSYPNHLFFIQLYRNSQSETQFCKPTHNELQSLELAYPAPVILPHIFAVLLILVRLLQASAEKKMF